MLPLSRRIYTKNRMHIMLACDDTTTKSDKKHTDKHFVMILPDKNGLLTKVSVNKEASFIVLFKESFKLIQETYEIQ